jgi:hypothetical protein
MTTRSPMTDMGLIANGLALTVGNRIGDCRRSTSSAPPRRDAARSAMGDSRRSASCASSPVASMLRLGGREGTVAFEDIGVEERRRWALPRDSRQLPQPKLAVYKINETEACRDPPDGRLVVVRFLYLHSLFFFQMSELY